MAKRLLDFYPRPNRQGALNFTSPDSFAPYDNPQFITRVDFKDSEQSRWSGRFVWNSGPYVTVRPISAFTAIQDLHSYGQSITNSRTLAGGLTNVASLHWTRRPYIAAPSNPKSEASAALGIPQLQDSVVDRMGIPLVEVQGYTGLGDIDLQGPSITGNWQLKEQVSFQRGDHSLKAGAEFRQQYFFINMEARSRFDFFDRYTGHALGDFLLGYPAPDDPGGRVVPGQPAPEQPLSVRPGRLEVELTADSDPRTALRGEIPVEGQTGIRLQFRSPPGSHRGVTLGLGLEGG